MNRLIVEAVTVRGTPDEVWAVIEDVEALGRVLPGAERLVATGPGTFQGVLAAKVQFMTVRAEVAARFDEADPPRHLRLIIDGRPRGLAGGFQASIPFDLAPSEAADGGAATTVTYSVDLTTSGRLAVFGAPLMRDTMRRQVAALVANLDQELEARRARDPGRPG